jgi:hypothetical protein
MTLRALLAALRGGDARLAVAVDGRLAVDAPIGGLTDNLWEEVRRRRGQLRVLVERYSQPYGPLGVLVATGTVRVRVRRGPVPLPLLMSVSSRIRTDAGAMGRSGSVSGSNSSAGCPPTDEGSLIAYRCPPSPT